MIELNLLKYFDKSFSEIYQIEHGEIEEAPKKKKKRVRINILTLSILLGILLILIAIFLTLNVFKEKPKIQKTPKNITQKTKTLSKNGSKTINRKNGKKYIKIGEIKIIDTKNTKLEKKEKTVIRKQTSSNKSKSLLTEKKKTDNNYSIRIYKLPNHKYKKLLQLAKSHHWKIIKLKTFKEKKEIWRIYKIVPSSKLYIAGKPVKYIKYNYKKEDAIKFVKKEKIKAVIKKDYITFVYYDLIIKNVKDKEIKSIKQLTKNSKITILKN